MRYPLGIYLSSISYLYDQAACHNSDTFACHHYTTISLMYDTNVECIKTGVKSQEPAARLDYYAPGAQNALGAAVGHDKTLEFFADHVGFGLHAALFVSLHKQRVGFLVGFELDGAA